MLDSTGKKCDKKHNTWVHGGTSSYVNVHIAHDVSDSDAESVGESDEEVEDIENNFILNVPTTAAEHGSVNTAVIGEEIDDPILERYC